METKEDDTKIKSFVRIKHKDNVLVTSNNTLEVTTKTNKKFIFSFDKIFGTCSKTEEIFEEFIPYFENKDFTNFTVLAYGQTGSGKTYTISGQKDECGLIQMILSFLIKKHKIIISFIEVYNEKIFDGIDYKEKSLREVKDKFYIPNLNSIELEDIKEFDVAWVSFMSHRKVAETQLNRQSSRSHTIIKIEADNMLINIVDLAGSENNKKTGNIGDRMKESQNINTSLFVLNKVVNSIVMKDKRVPYRDSKLTMLLKESLNGISKCFIIATVIDEIDDTGFTTSTLGFASKSRKIVNVIKHECCIVEDYTKDLYERIKHRRRNTTHLTEDITKRGDVSTSAKAHSIPKEGVSRTMQLNSVTECLGANKILQEGSKTGQPFLSDLLLGIDASKIYKRNGKEKEQYEDTKLGCPARVMPYYIDVHKKGRVDWELKGLNGKPTHLNACIKDFTANNKNITKTTQSSINKTVFTKEITNNDYSPDCLIDIQIPKAEDTNKALTPKNILYDNIVNRDIKAWNKDVNDSLPVKIRKDGADSCPQITKRKKKCGDSSSIIRGNLISNQIDMTPITKQKSKDCFMTKAIEYEEVGNYKMAIDTYKTINKISPSEEIEIKIAQLLKLKKTTNVLMSQTRALHLLNSGCFFDIKELNGVGDKRAKIIADFVSGGNSFGNLEDLKLLFTQKIVDKIRSGITD